MQSGNNTYLQEQLHQRSLNPLTDDRYGKSHGLAKHCQPPTHCQTPHKISTVCSLVHGVPFFGRQLRSHGETSDLFKQHALGIGCGARSPTSAPPRGGNWIRVWRGGCQTFQEGPENRTKAGDVFVFWHPMCMRSC